MERNGNQRSCLRGACRVHFGHFAGNFHLCQLVDQLTALSAYLKHYLLNYWNCLCCVFVRKWCALCISKDPSTQKRCCVQPICWPIYPSRRGILFPGTQHKNLRNKTTELAHPIHNQKNQNLDQWYLATKQRMSGLSTLG